MNERVIAVTGGHGELGRAVVAAALAQGLKVAVIDHATGQPVPQGVLELGGVDLTDPVAATAAVAAVVKAFKRLDAVLNIAGGFVWQTVDDLKSAAGMGAYAASKSAVHRLTESLAEELKSTPVTVNAVLPSILDTPQNRKDMPDADPAQWVAPADLAAVMLFLASPQARAITGALIPVTGRV